ncbi:fluoride efflux transporter CrcB [Paenibacillus sp. FSL W7-1287]|uniref:fluoride efflux transporter CrcB n=1 Tax=Paenibacillus sp. FSL W7-1287 TaxID=2954538 RepID=UPI0030FABDAB
MIILGAVMMGSLGACLRFYISQLTIWNHVKSFPYATLVINVTGSALLGILWSLYEHQLISELAWQWIGVGFFGAFTTFSTFSYELVQLIERKRWTAAAAYMLVTVILGTAIAAIGIAIIGYFC